jgi:nucleoside-triphosphatase THEP1
MELFIELTGEAASGKTRIINSIREMLEKDYHINWRQHDEAPCEAGKQKVQVIADLARRK